MTDPLTFDQIEVERFSHVSGESIPELLRRVRAERFDPKTHEYRRQRFFIEQLRKTNQMKAGGTE